MADLSKHFDLGEYGKDAVIESVELSGAITSADYGRIAKITGVATDGLSKVAKGSGNTDKANYVIIRGSEGKVGDMVQMLVRGTVKVLFGGAVSAGGSLEAKAGKVIAKAGSASPETCGWSRVTTTADLDTGLIYFQHG